MIFQLVSFMVILITVLWVTAFGIFLSWPPFGDKSKLQDLAWLVMNILPWGYPILGIFIHSYCEFV